jgi:hypothetical protein
MKAKAGLLSIAIPFIWVGCIGSISFMEAWLKFTAPGVTLQTGLAIGQVVFGALNRLEIAFAGIVAGAILYGKDTRNPNDLLIAMALIALAVQAFWLLPFLSARVDLYRSGITPPPSNAHYYFILLEIIKSVSLLAYGIKQLLIWKI